MKTVWVAVLALVVGLAGGWWLQAGTSVVAQEGGRIIVHSTQPTPSGIALEAGADCSYGLAATDGFLVGNGGVQVIVRNSSGNIESVTDLKGTISEEADACEGQVEIPLSDSTAYTIWVGDQLAKAISMNDITAGNAPEIWLVFT